MARRGVYVSDAAWEGLKQMAYECGYVRGGAPTDRPRGLSHFVAMLSWQKYKDTRPDYLLETGQWVTGLEYFKQRCLEIKSVDLASLGFLALEHGIYPYRSQMPVANGFRRHAKVPKVYAIGATPLGASSVAALVGPVLDAIGVGHLTPVVRLPQAPPDLYAHPSKRFKHRKRKADSEQTMM